MQNRHSMRFFYLGQYMKTRHWQVCSYNSRNRKEIQHLDSCMYSILYAVRSLYFTQCIFFCIQSCLGVHSMSSWSVIFLNICRRIQFVSISACLFMFYCHSWVCLCMYWVSLEPAVGLLQCWTVCYLQILDHITHENQTASAYILTCECCRSEQR